jgi:predicted SAM-dependent methyltransferase
MRKLLFFFFTQRTLALVRWDIHFVQVRLANALFRRGNKVVRGAGKRDAKYLNLGSGPRGKADGGWINVDGYRDRNVDICLDFNRRLPFPDGQFEGIFCEHVFEHFDFEQGQALLKECLRVLRPGGRIRIIVPDGEKILRTYLDNPGELVERRGPDNPFAMDAVNSYFRQRYEHQFIYDWPLLEHQFSRAGFTGIERAGYMSGGPPTDILLDDAKYEWESLYVDAVRPA